MLVMHKHYAKFRVVNSGLLVAPELIQVFRRFYQHGGYTVTYSMTQVKGMHQSVTGLKNKKITTIKMGG